MKGNHAIAEGAILGGCLAYFGYPITPSSELLEYMSVRMVELGRVFIQAESEVAAINMVYGAAAAGARAMTATSSPGFSLKQEGLSYLAANELPCVVVDVARAGPGLGGIAPAQGDYFQATKGGGHGDYRCLVLAPFSVQEALDLTMLAFELADQYRNPAILLADGLLGQMMEPVELRQPVGPPPEKPWALTGARARQKNVIRSLYLDPKDLEPRNLALRAKYEAMVANEVRYAGEMLDDAEVVLVAYGVSARVARTAMRWGRAEGLAVGLFRPISLYPFPYGPLSRLSERARTFVSVELSMGQMIEDVQLAVGGRAQVRLASRLGGYVISPAEILEVVRQVAERRPK